MKNKIKDKFKKIKKHYQKMSANENWHTRYNNLEKKYILLEEENKKLAKKLDKDLQNQEIENLKKTCLNYKRQRDILREELKEK